MDFSNIQVLCVGDVMLDRFVHCDMERISPEAPVPILRLRGTREMLGGAGNVASNVAALGGTAVLAGLVGQDAAGDAVRRLLRGVPRLVSAAVDTPSRPTTCKTRFIAANQQVVRADEESLAAVTAPEEAGLLDAVRAWIGRVGAVVLADYGKGALTPGLVAQVVGLARAGGVPVFVDPKSPDFTHYRGATCITPNLKELAAAAGMAVDGEGAIVQAACRVLAQAGAGAILVTRSERGMTLVEASGAVQSVPARARAVFDVSGAGDTVIAALALCCAAGRTLAQAMHVANAAASVVVSKPGTATATVQEVMQELDAQDHDQDHDRAGAPGQDGARPLAEVQALVARWKAQGLQVGLTNGCFDILHPGHVSLLAQARAGCDRLVVALNTDAGVRRLKGLSRPVNTLDGRARVVAALRHVDAVVAFDEPTPLELIRTLLPDVLVKGADYALDQVVGADVVRAAGGRVLLAPLVPGQSTTGIVARLRQPVIPA
jgi:D-beta-D-heptose 7-phosphate kinase/D-beta-D-heptose 1-phosphate adenosyltransferase